MYLPGTLPSFSTLTGFTSTPTSSVSARDGAPAKKATAITDATTAVND
jgi:hypothetical protein